MTPTTSILPTVPVPTSRDDQLVGPDSGDLVVTVPMGMWESWCLEGEWPEFPGEGTADEYHFTVGRRPPQSLQPGARIYIVSHGLLRGYAPLVRVERWDETRWSLVRAGGAVACTLADAHGEPTPIPGFRGARWRWWTRDQEIAFPDWMYHGVA